MISTSSYKNWQSDKYTTYSISGDRGKKLGYNGKCFPLLAPKLSFWKIWHSNIGVISEEENNRYYVEQYYKQVLSKLDPKEIYEKLDNSVLLCYEENTEFCHRHIVAAWLEILLDTKVPKAKAKDYDIETIERPDYIRKYLEEVMRKNRNMRGFNSLRALYLFEKSKQLEQEARKLKELYGKVEDYTRLMQKASFLRCDADETEQKYNEELVHKSCINCTNGSCNVDISEKVGLDEFGNPQGSNCLGWSNSKIKKTLRKI